MPAVLARRDEASLSPLSTNRYKCTHYVPARNYRLSRARRAVPEPPCRKPTCINHRPPYCPSALENCSGLLSAVKGRLKPYVHPFRPSPAPSLPPRVMFPPLTGALIKSVSSNLPPSLSTPTHSFPPRARRKLRNSVSRARREFTFDGASARLSNVSCRIFHRVNVTRRCLIPSSEFRFSAPPFGNYEARIIRASADTVYIGKFRRIPPTIVRLVAGKECLLVGISVFINNSHKKRYNGGRRMLTKFI